MCTAVQVYCLSKSMAASELGPEFKIAILVGSGIFAGTSSVATGCLIFLLDMGIYGSKPWKIFQCSPYTRVSEFELRPTDILIHEEKEFLLRYYWVLRSDGEKPADIVSPTVPTGPTFEDRERQDADSDNTTVPENTNDCEVNPTAELNVWALTRGQNVTYAFSESNENGTVESQQYEIEARCNTSVARGRGPSAVIALNKASDQLLICLRRTGVEPVENVQTRSDLEADTSTADAGPLESETSVEHPAPLPNGDLQSDSSLVVGRHTRTDAETDLIVPVETTRPSGSTKYHNDDVPHRERIAPLQLTLSRNPVKVLYLWCLARRLQEPQYKSSVTVSHVRNSTVHSHTVKCVVTTGSGTFCAQGVAGTLKAAKKLAAKAVHEKIAGPRSPDEIAPVEAASGPSTDDRSTEPVELVETEPVVEQRSLTTMN